MSEAKVKWCEHCAGKEGVAQNICIGGSVWKIGGDWKFCPICGTPSPTTPKTLAQELAEEFYAEDTRGNSPVAQFELWDYWLKESWRRVASKAKERLLGEDRVEGLIDLLRTETNQGAWPYTVVAKSILTFLREGE